jgi:hypothetical protein
MEGEETHGTASDTQQKKTVVGVNENAPRVVKFGYKQFTVSGDRLQALYKKCNKRIQDHVSVTSAFTKLVLTNTLTTVRNQVILLLL